MLSIFWYLRDEETLAARGNGQRITQWYWLSLLAFLLAMLSKGSVAILPLALLLIVWWRRRLVKSDLLRMAPFFAIAALLAAVNVWCQARLSEQPFRTADFIQRLDAAAGVLWFYLAKALLPIHLLLVYPQWHVQTSNVLWWLPLLAVVIMTAVLRRHLHSPYANWVRPILFAGAFFCISLLPVLGFTDVGFMEYSLVADHYLYIALIAVLALVAAGFSVWHDQARGPFRSAAMVAAVALVSTFALASWQQNRLYDNAITLYQATLNDNPDCWMVQNNLGSALIDVGRLPEAIAHLQKALRLTPGFAQAHFNLGTALHYSGRLPEAIEQFEQALQLKPNYSQAHNNLGNLLRQAGQLPAAIEHYQQALLLDPDYAEAHNNLGIALASLGKLSDAIVQYQVALKLNPDYLDAYNNLGNALVKSNRLQEAIQQYQLALRRNPNYSEAHANLAAALAGVGQLPEAIQQYQLALQLKPDNFDALANMALAYAKLNRPSEAIAAAEKAASLARSHGDPALARQIDAWLTQYRAQHAGTKGKSSPSDVVQPAPAP